MLFKSFIILAALAFFTIARKAHPAKAKKGNDFTGKHRLPFDKSTLTVATYNVQTGKSLKGKRDIHRAANVIVDADIIGIQEVYAPTWLNRIGFGISQTEALAGNGQFAWLFCATRLRWFREHRGNAILSKLAITAWDTQMLPDQSGKSYRNMTIVQLDWQGTNVVFINTHLHTRQGREEQLDIVLTEFRKHSHVILVGDFNSQRETPALANLLTSTVVCNTIAETNTGDRENRIDWILTKGFQVLSGHYVDKGVSDHPYYQIELALATD